MPREHWLIDKPAVGSSNGVVVSQHYLASEAGAKILRAGGNAFDAAIAASFAIGVVEPWMSGLGGGGVMIAAPAGGAERGSIFFGMRASRRLDPADYPLRGGTGGDLFAWPAVEEDRNVHGPYSVAVPGQVAGMAAAHRRYGSLPWAELLLPAYELAKAGFEADWHATMRIAAAAPVLSRYQASAELYLPDGFVPAGQWGGPPPVLRNQRLADTLERLARAGWEDFYRGEIGRQIVSDAAALGVVLDAGDLENYRVLEDAPLAIGYRGDTVYAAAGLTGGPTLQQVLADLADRVPAGPSPDSEHFATLAAALLSAFEARFADMGHDAADPACTTHISAVDGAGNTVSLTQTLLSVFGSKVTLPATGILMNNGVMWFDPRPGRANSIAPGVWPLANMCPVIVERGGGRRIAVGGSGGRRIIGAVAQLCSWLIDFDMDIATAMRQPRIDVSGGAKVAADPNLDDRIRTALAERFDIRVEQSMVYPNLYGCPNCASFVPGEGGRGAAFIYSPVSAAIGA